MKKYFAMSIIAASVALAACSDDDDDDEVPMVEAPGMEVPGGEEVPGGGVGEPVVEAPEATPGEGNTALDFVVNSPDHATLTELVEAAGLADTLDNPAEQFTIFAPTDAAFEAVDADFLAELSADTDRLARVLKHHVLAGSVQSGAIIEGVGAVADGEAPFSVATLAEAAPAQSLAFTAAEDGSGFQITDGAGNTVPLSGPLDLNVSTEVGAVTTGVVHVLDNVLFPQDADDPVVETPPEGGEGGENTPPAATGGAGDALLATAGNAEIFRAGLTTHQNGNIDTQAWTFFVPNDEILGAAGVTELSPAQLRAHILSAGPIDPAELAVASTVLASDTAVYDVATDADGNVTVGGFAVELIGTGAAGAQIYSIAGVLPGA